MDDEDEERSSFSRCLFHLLLLCCLLAACGFVVLLLWPCWVYPLSFLFSLVSSRVYSECRDGLQLVIVPPNEIDQEWTFKEAQKECEDMKTLVSFTISSVSLARIANQNQVEFIKDTLLESEELRSNRYWIGLRDPAFPAHLSLDDAANFSRFEFLEGNENTILEKSEGPWKDGEPNHKGTTEDEDPSNCVSMDATGWENRKCSEKIGYVCLVDYRKEEDRYQADEQEPPSTEFQPSTLPTVSSTTQNQTQLLTAEPSVSPTAAPTTEDENLAQQAMMRLGVIIAPVLLLLIILGAACTMLSKWIKSGDSNSGRSYNVSSLLLPVICCLAEAFK